MRASKKVHTDLIATVLGSTLRWLDTTPVSRIIVRATSDVGTRMYNFISPAIDVLNCW
jgi:hypothetical protein